MNKQIDLNDVVHAILRGMMDQHPSEITIGDFKLNCFYIASAAGKKRNILPLRSSRLPLSLLNGSRCMVSTTYPFPFGLLTRKGNQPNGQICHPTKYSTCLFTTIC